MYALPADPTVADIIARSIACHPSLFAEALDNAARAFRLDAEAMHHRVLYDTAKRLAAAANSMSLLIIQSGIASDELARAFVLMGMDSWTTALNIASRLQCLPPHIKAEAAAKL